MADLSVAPVRAGAPWMTILQIVLVILKSSGVITASWGLVLLPLWLSIGVIGLALIVGVGVFIWAATH